MIGWLRRGYRAWVQGSRAEMIRTDAWALGILYEKRPVPFWPADIPEEEAELPYKPAGEELVDLD